MKELVFPFAIATAFAMMGVDTAVTMLPRAELSNFFTVDGIEAKRVGKTAHLKVDRTIHHPIHMSFIVRVQKRGLNGWTDDCTAPEVGPILYQPDAELPDPITLDWWTWGACVELPEGPARIVTTWIPEPNGLSPVTVVSEVE